MAEDNPRGEDAGGAQESARETADGAGDGVQGTTAGVVDRVRGVLDGGDGNGVGGKVLIPAGVAAAAAVGYAAVKAAPKVKDSLSSKAADQAEETAESALAKAEDKGGVTGVAAKLFKKGGDGGGGDGGGMLGGLASKVGLGGGKKEPSKGWGNGRRNPIQRYCDVGVPVETAYNQWTQFEEFPKFMHRVVSVNQDDDDRAKLKWEQKIWFWKRDWEAEITEQVPDYKIAWKTVSGTSHVGQVSFHALSENMTRVLVTIDFNPAGLFEKMASGLRFVKRAAESDLCRFKAFIEAHGEATGAWRGRIEDGEVVEDPGVEEGRPLEETEELRTPGGRAAGEKDDDGGDDEDGDSGPQAGATEEMSDEEREQREKEREERERRREERRAATPS
ncbi:MAG: SRPBCC family protein [Thermoleophilia bacterium]|nr:SRPBCC family protein [Thermoleophilia bacterium]